MAELHNEASAGSRKQRAKRMSTRIDFTPMVDLGFLLITFFMLTTVLGTPYVLDIMQPADGPPTPLQDSLAMTVLLSGQNKVYYYFGFAESGVHATDFSASGLRKLLLEKNNLRIEKNRKLEALRDENRISEETYLEQSRKLKSEKSLMVIIKSDEHSMYKNLVDVLDELLIAQVSRYAIQDITREELDYIAAKEVQ